MPLTPTITFRGLRHSDWLENQVLARVRKLETYYDRIVGCRVLVELEERHHESGNRYHVRIDLTVPGEEIVVAHDGGLYATARDVGADKLTKATETDRERKHARAALREAFETARRSLQDFTQRQRDEARTSPRAGARGRAAAGR